MEHIKTMYPRFSLPFQLGSLDDSLGRGRRAYSFSESEADISTGKSNQAELKDNVSEWIDNSPTRLTKEFQVPSNTPYIPGKTIRAQHMIIPKYFIVFTKKPPTLYFFRYFTETSTDEESAPLISTLQDAFLKQEYEMSSKAVSSISRSSINEADADLIVNQR